MSFFPIPKKSYADDRPTDQRRKNQRITSKKVKLPTQLRTKREKCSLCKEDSVQKIQISDTEFRNLCSKHFADWKRKDLKYSVRFEKASE